MSGFAGGFPIAPCTPSGALPFEEGLKCQALQGAFRSFRNLNRRGLQPLVSVDAFAAALCATGA